MTERKPVVNLTPYLVCPETRNNSRRHLAVCKAKCENYDVCLDRARHEEFLSEHPDGVNPNAEEV